MYPNRAVRGWRCLSWPHVVALWMITIITLTIEVRVGVSLPVAVGVVTAASVVTSLTEWCLSRPLVWASRALGPWR